MEEFRLILETKKRWKNYMIFFWILGLIVSKGTFQVLDALDDINDSKVKGLRKVYQWE